MKLFRSIASPFLLLALAPFARADFLDGRVLGSNGLGVASVNITARNSGGGGGGVSLVNAGTDANGFFHVTIPAGTFEITFQPPQPPASSGLITVVDPVTVAGTANIGNVVLTPGVVLSGRIVNSAAVGVSGVNFDVLDAGGVNATLRYDQTDALGNFIFAAPVGSTELRIDTSGVIGQTLAPLAIALNATSDVNFGTIVRPQGYVVSAIVRNSGGIAVPNCDVDTFDTATGSKLYTPGDDSNASGFVDFVVPAGTYRFQFCPLLATRLVSRDIGPSTVAANTSLGIVTLQAGVILSGTIRNGQGQGVANADVDVRDHTTLVQVPLCGEASTGSGQYATVVPVGTFDVFFDGPPGSGLGSDARANVSITADTVLDGVLPAFSGYCFGDGTGTACPCGNTAAPGSGTGCLSSLGVGGRITAVGAASIAADTLVLGGTQMPNSSALYFQGTAQQNGGLGSAFGDGLRCASGSVLRLGTKTNVSGTSQYPVVGDLPISIKGANVAGGTRAYQVWYRNAAAFCTVSTFNLTNGLLIPWAP
ncbi:MAG: hypothetical protein NTY35_01775 [Planctomycetota bacterium]|nr:hypothetical protein [Planctomycetota bacterium]